MSTLQKIERIFVLAWKAIWLAVLIYFTNDVAKLKCYDQRLAALEKELGSL